VNIRQTFRHIRRRQQIVGVLIKNGLGFLVQRYGLGPYAPVARRGELVTCRREADELLAFNLRQSLVELGPTFIKLGQVLSTRSDLLPPVYIEQLERLQDKVPALPYEEIEKQLRQQIGDPDEIFAEFDRNPLAAASLGQVHRARLRSGEQVIVKVQRPNIENKVEDDLQMIINLARMAESRSQDVKRLGIVPMIEDYARMFLRELDYAREARNTERIYNNFANDDRVLVPRVCWQYTTGKVLTEEYIEGVKLNNIAEMKRRGWDVRKISRLGTESFLTQIIIHGFFQADPHPGNILILEENRIAFVDFGEIGTLSESRLVSIGELLVAISQDDMDKAMVALEDMGLFEQMSGSRDDFQEDFEDLVKSVTSGGVGNVDMNRLRKELMGLSYNYHLQLPSYLTSLLKALITVEGVGKKLDPGYDFMDTARPLAMKVYTERIKPENITRYLRRKYYKDIKPLGSLPGNFNHLVKNAAEGKVNLTMQMELSDKTYHRLSQLVSRLSVSLIITGGLVGSALLFQSGHPEVMDQYARVGAAGFILAMLGLVVFIIASWKS
jgi:ubiquinone biosynthesis protein